MTRAISPAMIPPSLQKIEHQTLDTERDELGLVRLTLSCIPKSSQGEKAVGSESIVSVEMKTGSPYDYSEDSRRWMKSKGKATYLFMDHLATAGALRSKESPNMTQSGQISEDAKMELRESLDFGR